MTIVQILARVAVYGAGWGITGVVLGLVFAWSTETTDRMNLKVGLELSAVVWALIFGIIYW